MKCTCIPKEREIRKEGGRISEASERDRYKEESLKKRTQGAHSAPPVLLMTL